MNKLQSWLAETKFIKHMQMCDAILKSYRRHDRIRTISSQMNFGEVYVKDTYELLIIGAEFNKNKYWFMRRLDLEDVILKLEKHKEQWRIK